MSALAAGCVVLAIVLLPRSRSWQDVRVSMLVRRRRRVGGTTGSVGAARSGGWSARWRGKGKGRDLVVTTLLEALDLIAAALRAGQPPDRALRYAVSVLTREGDEGGALSSPHSRRAHSQRRDLLASLRDLATPADVATAFGQLASVHGIPALGYVARAWHLAEASGAPLASAVDLGASLLRYDREHEQALAVALAGPRATIRLLTILPLSGPVVGMALGLDPVAMYAGSPVGVACLTGGLALVAGGHWWCRRLIRDATGEGSGGGHAVVRLS